MKRNTGLTCLDEIVNCSCKILIVVHKKYTDSGAYDHVVKDQPDAVLCATVATI